MLIRFLILAILLAGVAFMLGREVLLLGEARRRGEDEKRLYRRFRRRTKGLVLLVALYCLAAFYDEVAAWAGFTWREVVLYSGITLIFMVWALILAGRDLKETALEAVVERQRLKQDVFKDITEEIERRKSGPKKAPKKGGGKK